MIVGGVRAIGTGMWRTCVKKILILLSMAGAAAALCRLSAPLSAAADQASEVIALERKAMDGWAHGNPDPFLASADPEITYFHVMTEKRVEGLPAVRALVEPYRSRPLFDSYEMLEPKVQVAGDTAVLTYILLRRVGGDSSRWNGTEVFQKKTEGWRLIHAHWSQTAPR